MQKSIGSILILTTMILAILSVGTFAGHPEIYSGPGGGPIYTENIVISNNRFLSEVKFEGLNVHCLASPAYNESWDWYSNVHNYTYGIYTTTNPQNPGNAVFFKTTYSESNPYYPMLFVTFFSNETNAGIIAISYGVSGNEVQCAFNGNYPSYGIFVTLTPYNGQYYLTGTIDGCILIHVDIGTLKANQLYSIGFSYNESTTALSFIVYNGTMYNYVLVPCISGHGLLLNYSIPQYEIVFEDQNNAFNYPIWGITSIYSSD